MERSPSPRVNEASSLLPNSIQSEARSLRQLSRSRYAFIPILIIAFVGILWVSSIASSGETEVATTKSAHSVNQSSSPASDSDLVTFLPPFESYLHPLPPKLINRTNFQQAIPTNAFWTNLLVADDHGLNPGAGQITLSPYTVRHLPRRLEISYGDSRRVVTSGNITEYFNVDIAFTGYSRRANMSVALLGDGNSTAREVLSFDSLSAMVQYRFEGESSEDATQFMNVLLVRGAPYVTVEYQHLLPVIEMNATRIITINQIPVEVLYTSNWNYTRKWTASRFEIDLEVYSASKHSTRQKWVLYFAQKRTLQLQFAQEWDPRLYNERGELTTPTFVRLVDTDYYTGPARLAIVPGAPVGPGDGLRMATLDKYASVYPISASVLPAISKTNALEANIEFQWKTKAFGTGDPDALLLLAHPHHVATLAKDTTMLPSLGHRTLKSYMTPVVGTKWILVETLPDVGFFGNDTRIQNASYLAEIQSALQLDSNYTPVAQDPYFFGKEISRQARLVLIADTLDQLEIRDHLLNQLEHWVQPWLMGKNTNPFNYDQSWGGLCSSNGLSGLFWMTDFGNGWYNDHHFHYGYFLYALAVVAKYRPVFATTHQAAILSIVRDIASIDTNDTYFPVTRHFSWFDGHSFASGIYTLDGGKSQESVSEAINAYYGVYLLGQALNLSSIQQIGHILVTLESRAAQTYWQMPSESTIYESEYAQHKMNGQIACTRVSYMTWFGPEMEHMHLINMIPFTPITSTFLSRQYVQQEFPLLQEQAFHRVDSPPIDARWAGYAYLDQAIIDPETAWKHVQTLDFFDDGNSRTNSLYWIATRPI